MDEDKTGLNLEHIREVIISSTDTDLTGLKTYEECFTLVLNTLLRRFADVYNFNWESKLAERSIKSRQNGNESFSGGQYYNALKEYTESIMYAVNSSEEQALAYGDRSAALYTLEKFEDCIKDIERALEGQYPDKFKYKLYRRKGFALMYLRRSGATSAFQEALIWLDQLIVSKDERYSVQDELRIMISVSRESYVIRSEEEENELPQIIKPNPKILSASDAVALKYSKEYGLHLVATRRIKPGEILILEKAYCKRLHHEFICKNCSYCLIASLAMIPCNYCPNAAYCSEACRDKAWDKYHEIECSVVGALLRIGVADQVCLTMRMAIIATCKGTKLDALREELVIIDSNPDPCAKLYSDDGKLHSDHYRSLHCSQANEVDITCIGKLIMKAIHVAITVCVLAKESNIFGKKLALETLANNPDVRFLGGLMCKHLHLGAHMKTRTIGTKTGSGLIVYGHSMLAVSSLLNHSCDPNTSKQKRSDLKYMYFALRTIEKGEQIFNSYGPEFRNMEKPLRQMHCCSWNFSCNCDACREDWPLIKDVPSYWQQSLPAQNVRKVDEAMQKLERCAFSLPEGTKMNDPNIKTELVHVIEALCTFTKKPCRELTEAGEMLKLAHIANEAIMDYGMVDEGKTEMQTDDDDVP